MTDQSPTPDQTPQAWVVPVTPAQRWQLFQLVFNQQAVAGTGKQGRAAWRMIRAFGLSPIRQAVEKGGGRVDAKALAGGPVLHVITAENLKTLAEITDGIPRSTATEAILGEFYDAIERVQAGQPDPAWASLPAFSTVVEHWEVPTDPEPDALETLVCPSCAQRCTYVEAKAAAARASEQAP